MNLCCRLVCYLGAWTIAWTIAGTPNLYAQRIALFDGETLNGWVTDQGEPVTKGWHVVEGILSLDVSQGRAGHILTEQEYGDFVLEFEWKISKGGNSGLKYKVKKFANKRLGCEYQILDDDRHKDGKVPKKSSASLYDLYTPGNAKRLNPVGEFNHSRIVVNGRSIEHWLNGQQVVNVCVGSCDWYAKKEASKFSDVGGFGENTFGKIMLTDHKSAVAYRNIYLTPIKPGVRVVQRMPKRGRLIQRISKWRNRCR